MSLVKPTAAALFVLFATLAAQEAPPAFEVASVRQNTVDKGIPFVPNPPDGITLINRPLEMLVRSAYDVQFFRVVGMPPWAKEKRFDIDALDGWRTTLTDLTPW